MLYSVSTSHVICIELSWSNPHGCHEYPIIVEYKMIGREQKGHWTQNVTTTGLVEAMLSATGSTQNKYIVLLGSWAPTRFNIPRHIPYLATAGIPFGTSSTTALSNGDLSITKHRNSEPKYNNPRLRQHHGKALQYRLRLISLSPRKSLSAK